MAADPQTHWLIGGLSREDSIVDANMVCEIGEARFAELKAQARLVADAAAQRDYFRLLDTVARWEGLLARAADELADAGQLSRWTRKAATLDLQAVVHAISRVEAAVPDTPRIAEVRHRVRAMPSYLLLHQFA